MNQANNHASAVSGGASQQPANSSLSSRPPRTNPDQPMTLAERDDLITQINSLTAQQSEGIIKIVSEHAQKDGQQNYTFELTQLPLAVSRQLEQYVKKCITENDKKKRRKEQDARRRAEKTEKAKLE